MRRSLSHNIVDKYKRIGKIATWSPNDFWASRLADSSWVSNSSGVMAILMPFPPPPRTALIIRGKPIFSASCLNLSSLWSSPWYPWITVIEQLLKCSFIIILLLKYSTGYSCCRHDVFRCTINKNKQYQTCLSCKCFWYQEDYLLIPMSLMADAGGPMNMIPSFEQSSANSTFSDKKPYPGCMAWAPVLNAASKTLSFLR